MYDNVARTRLIEQAWPYNEGVHKNLLFGSALSIPNF